MIFVTIKKFPVRSVSAETVADKVGEMEDQLTKIVANNLGVDNYDVHISIPQEIFRPRVYQQPTFVELFYVEGKGRTPEAMHNILYLLCCGVLGYGAGIGDVRSVMGICSPLKAIQYARES